MASGLGQFIEQLQAVEQSRTAARKLVAYFEDGVEEGELKLAERRQQLMLAKEELRRWERNAEVGKVLHQDAAFHRFGGPRDDQLFGATPNPPDDGESVRVSIPASKPSNIQSATTQSTGAEAEDATITVTHKREADARGSDVCRTKAPPSIHRRYPIVVYFEGSWIEISCNHCGANSGINSREFMKGVVGLGRHIKLHAANECGVFPIAENSGYVHEA
ncbi:hypothetical protein LTR86_010657 [Recurvomyces mirabilis]|nr:hypothetical protein LTR86_010657 [Recurvomyces mirabilis]